MYAPSGTGVRLVAVEYMMPLSTWSGGVPDLSGQPFDGPMPEHEHGTSGDHYDQHAWVPQPRRRAGHVEPVHRVLSRACATSALRPAA